MDERITMLENEKGGEGGKWKVPLNPVEPRRA